MNFFLFFSLKILLSFFSRRSITLDYESFSVSGKFTVLFTTYFLAAFPFGSGTPSTYIFIRYYIVMI